MSLIREFTPSLYVQLDTIQLKLVSVQQRIILIIHNPERTVFFTAYVYHIWVLSIPITIN